MCEGDNNLIKAVSNTKPPKKVVEKIRYKTTEEYESEFKNKYKKFLTGTLIPRVLKTLTNKKLKTN